MAKKSKSLLPKTIAGLKVPKAVRKGQFGEMLASPTGQKLLAQAILAVGSAAAASARKIKDSDAVEGAQGKLNDRKAAAKAVAADASGALVYALGEAVRSFTDALHRHELGETSAETGDAQKYPISYEAGTP